jgi:hypothetical protein
VTAVVEAALRDQLFDRRGRLAAALPAAGREAAAELRHLLDEVDAALERFESGSFGLCEVCHDPVEADRLAADPLVRFCLDHLTSLQRRAPRLGGGGAARNLPRRPGGLPRPRRAGRRPDGDGAAARGRSAVVIVGSSAISARILSLVFSPGFSPGISDRGRPPDRWPKRSGGTVRAGR